MKTNKGTQYLKIAMGDGDKTIRAQAIEAAGKSGLKDLVPALLYRLKYDDEPKVMVAAALALQTLGNRAAVAIVIKKFESSRDNGILVALLGILDKENAREAIPVLQKKQAEMKNSSIKDRIADLLKKWGTKTPLPDKPGKPEAGKQNNKKPDQTGTPSGTGKRIYLQ